MKIKSIAAICKKSKMVHLVNYLSKDGEITQQYIGDGVAMYPVTGLPVLDKDSILTIFDIPERQRSDWVVREDEDFTLVNLDDLDLSDKLIDKNLPVGIDYAGKSLKPIPTSKGIVFLESKYLTPILDTADLLEYYERKTRNGNILVAVKAGLLLHALIVPYIMPPEAAEMIQEIASRPWHSWEEQKTQEPENAYRINLETGEVIES